MSRSACVRCFAKINTVLRVLGPRPDGFHDLDTEFVALDLHDTLEARPAGELTLEVHGAMEAEVPVGGNLVLAAAQALQEEVGAARLPGAALRLTKRIPAAAGLGGGSSDAAGALEALVRLHALDVPGERLAALALGIGSDVPYFLRGGRQRGRGRGEVLEALPDRPDLPVVLVKPRRPLSTASVFREHARWRLEHPDVPCAGALTKRKTGLTLPSSWWDEAGGGPHDDLADAALRLMPEIAEIAERTERAFPEGVVGMTGSGPTIFALLPAGADGVAARLRGILPHADAWLTRTIGSEEWRARRWC